MSAGAVAWDFVLDLGGGRKKGENFGAHTVIATPCFFSVPKVGKSLEIRW